MMDMNLNCRIFFNRFRYLQIYSLISGLIFCFKFSSTSISCLISIDIDSQRPKLKIEQFLKKRMKKRFALNNENGEMVLEFSRIFNNQYSNSFVEKIDYEKSRKRVEKGEISQKLINKKNK